MSLTIPTIPSLPAGHVVTLTDMQNLASAATFLLGKPIALVQAVSGSQSVTTNFTSFNGFTSGGVIYDPDGMWSNSNPSRLTIQTPGWYKVRYAVNFGTVGGTYNAAIRSTTGANNPAGSGVLSGLYWGSYADGASADVVYAGASGLWPAYLYAGDYLQIMMEAAATGSSTGLTQPDGTSGGGTFFGLEFASV